MNHETRDFALRECGCVATHLWRRKQGLPLLVVLGDKHHLNAFDMPGGKRRGEKFTVCLSQWSHVGRCWCSGSPVERDCPECKARSGPSWRWHKREFLDTFGEGDALLAEQDRLIAAWLAGTVTGVAA